MTKGHHSHGEVPGAAAAAAANPSTPKKTTNKRQRSNADSENTIDSGQPAEYGLQTPKNTATGGRGNADIDFTAKRAKKGKCVVNQGSPTTAGRKKENKSVQPLSRSSHLNSLSNRGTGLEAMKTQRNAEVEHQVSTLLRANVPKVLKLARPANESRARLAMSIGKRIAADLESRLAPPPPLRRSSRLASQPHQSPQPTNTRIAKSDCEIHKVTGNSRNELQSDEAYAEHTRRLERRFNALKTWVKQDYWTNNAVRTERQMYRPIQAFHLFVAQFIRYHLNDSAFDNAPNGIIGPPRLVLPYENVDTKAVGTDDRTRSDIGLVVCGMDADAALVEGKPYNSEQFAIIEAKASVSRAAAAAKLVAAKNAANRQDGMLDADTTQAFKQLFMYTRQVYANQHDRRFMWGITVCDTRVSACILTSGGALASHEMDVSTVQGRRQYIQLLVDWSLCDWHQLGFDPSVRWRKDLKYWEIDVPCLAATASDGSDQQLAASSTTTTYFFDKAYVAADHLFGRHTRCFPASLERPESNKPIEPDVLVKDAWSYVRRNDAEQSEVSFMDRIRQMLEQEQQLRNNLPTLVDGGPVCIDSNGTLVNDTTDSILGEIHSMLPSSSAGDDSSSDYYYAHNRLAMTPIAKRLRLIPSIADLMLVMHDAVRAHKAVLDNCHVLHRDISENNIMFHHDADGHIHGMLIDFDNAVDSGAAQQDSRPICTGTLPFMSVNNLRRENVPRTAVDDMESFLYLLLWLGTWGVTIEHREQTIEKTRMITEWSLDSDMAIKSKRQVMESDKSLHYLLAELYGSYTMDSDIIVSDEEYEWYSRLRNLVRNLRNSIFDNPRVDSAARGTWIPRANLLSSWNGGDWDMPTMAAGAIVDEPNAYRARAAPDIAQLIHEDVLSVFEWYANQVRALESHP
ncbi:hypothetical protein IWW48_005492 [Coemansia sp. RSA 1200]|nr:hypothetical protein IWW48_005492 [Coemansia sp. RSA 1200]